MLSRPAYRVVRHIVGGHFTKGPFCPRRRFLSSMCLVLVLSLLPSCSSENRYRKKCRKTVKDARHVSYAWEVVQIRESYPNASILNQRRRTLVDKIRKRGIDWGRDGQEVAFQEVIEGAEDAGVRELSRVDAWGQPYEYRIVDDYLVIRSSGADRVFDSDEYKHGPFPWLSGGDFVIVGGTNIRWPDWPKPYDWLEDGF